MKYKYTANIVEVDGVTHVVNADGSTIRLPILVAQSGKELPDYCTNVDRMIHNRVKMSIESGDPVGFDYITRAEYDCDEAINLITGRDMSSSPKFN